MSRLANILGWTGTVRGNGLTLAGRRRRAPAPEGTVLHETAAAGTIIVHSVVLQYGCPKSDG